MTNSRRRRRLFRESAIIPRILARQNATGTQVPGHGFTTDPVAAGIFESRRCFQENNNELSHQLRMTISSAKKLSQRRHCLISLCITATKAPCQNYDEVIIQNLRIKHHRWAWNCLLLRQSPLTSHVMSFRVYLHVCTLL